MSFRIALTGLDAATSDLSVTADNIANNNTTGYKSSRAEFADIVAASGIGAISSNVIGDGTQLAGVSQQFSQGNITFTGNPLDMAISGQGFYRMNDGGSIVYSRAGTFGTDRNGFVINNLGHRLTGFGADSSGNITGALQDLVVSTADISPQVTGTVTLGANLDAAASTPVPAFSVSDPASYNNSTSVTFYDTLGSAHTATMYFRKTGANAWNHYLAVDGAQVGGATAMTFTTAGALSTPAGGVITSAGFTPAGAGLMTFDMNVSAVTQYGSQFGVNSLSQDGFSSGSLTGLEIESNGVMFARYTNGQSLALGQVTLANFANTQGLTRLGENSWTESFSSGPPLIGAPGSATLGLIQSGALEDSNVELTEQLVNMINAQRNFQANAQVINASDTLTQTILNIG